ncbi:hypothetical protein C8N37_101766 [Sphingobacterium faecium]|nr:hypothetical protein C8N37_101766 [Sphingobacterium faecium]
MLTKNSLKNIIVQTTIFVFFNLFICLYQVSTARLGILVLESGLVRDLFGSSLTAIRQVAKEKPKNKHRITKRSTRQCAPKGLGIPQNKP